RYAAPRDLHSFPTRRSSDLIADEVDLRGRDALPKKVDPGVFLGDEEQIRDGVRQQAVDFFRHRPVEAAEPRLDVDEREAELDGGDRKSTRLNSSHVAISYAV